MSESVMSKDETDGEVAVEMGEIMGGTELLEGAAALAEDSSLDPWEGVQSPQSAMVGLYFVFSDSASYLQCNKLILDLFMGCYAQDDGLSEEKRGELIRAVSFLAMHDISVFSVAQFARDMVDYAVTEGSSLEGANSLDDSVLELGLGEIKSLMEKEWLHGGVPLERWESCLSTVQRCINLHSASEAGSNQSFFCGLSDVFGPVGARELLRPGDMAWANAEEVLARSFFDLLDVLGMADVTFNEELVSCPGDHEPIFALREYREALSSLDAVGISSLARAIPPMTWGKLREFSLLLGEYNVEWALAAFEWE